MATNPSADGLLIVDKPADWTSHDVVGRVRRLASTRKVGHAGTLDPMATGVLVVGVNKATKLLTFLVGCDKSYDATIRLGIATVTDDAEGETTERAGAEGIDAEAIVSGIRALTGEIQQVPTAVSAIKVDGQRSYARVRAGEDVVLAARPVTVSRFELVARRDGEAEGVSVIDLDVSLDVSSGTYVRALARDLGAALGCGGHLTALRRTRVGGYDLTQAHTLDTLAGLVEAGQSLPLLGLADAAAAVMPVRQLSDDEYRTLRFGQRLESQERGRDPVAAVQPDGRLGAILDETGARARSHVVFVD